MGIQYQILIGWEKSEYINPFIVVYQLNPQWIYDPKLLWYGSRNLVDNFMYPFKKKEKPYEDIQCL